MAFLSNGTRSLLTETSDFQQHLNNLRDGFRDKLSDADGARFPRFGQAAIGLFKLLCRVIGSGSVEAIGRLDCTYCHKPRIQDMRTLGHHPTDTMCKLFTIYMDSTDVARRVLVRKYLLKIGYQPITSIVFGHTPLHHSLLPAPVRSARMYVRQDSVYKSLERLHSSLSTYRIGT